MERVLSVSETNPATEYAVFIDTNLNTHLVLNISAEDRIHDLKKKIVIEHVHCFPDVGEIQIHALKVRRRGFFYHLSDSMLVKSVFEMSKRTWFLYVDAFSSQVESQSCLAPNVSKPGAFICITNDQLAEKNILTSPLKNLTIPNDVPCLPIVSSQVVGQKVSLGENFGPGAISKDVSNELDKEAKDVEGDNCEHSLFDAKKTLDSKLSKKCNLDSDTIKVSGTHIEQQKEGSHSGMGDIPCINVLELPVQPEIVVKKVNKIKKKAEVSLYDAVKDPSKESDPMINISGERTSEQEAIISVRDAHNVNIPTSDGLSTKALEDDHLFDTTINTGKRKKKKKKKSLDSEAPFAEHAREKASGAPKNSDSGLNKESDAANSVEKGISMCRTDADKVGEKRDASELPASRGSKKKRIKKHVASKMRGLPVPVVEEDNLLKFGNEVDSAAPSSMENVEAESARVSGNDYKNSGEESDSVLATKNAVQGVNVSKSGATYEKVKIIPDKGGEGNTVPFSSLHGSHEKIASVDHNANSSIDKCECDPAKVESKEDASGQAVAAGRRKVKRSKKQRAANAESLSPSVVAKCDDQKKDVSSSGADNIIRDVNKCGTNVNDTGRREEQGFSQKTDANIVASEQCKSSCTDGIDKKNERVVVLNNLLDATVSEAEDPGNKRKKKLKRAKKSDAKGGLLEADAKVNYVMNGCTNEDNSLQEPSKLDGDKVYLIDYFMPSEGQHEVVASAKELVYKETKMKRSDTEERLIKGQKTIDMHFRGASPDLQNLFRSNDNLGRKRKTRGDTSNIVQPKLKDKNGDMPHNDEESLVLARGSGEATTSHSSVISEATPVNDSRHKIATAVGVASPLCMPVTQSPSRSSNNPPLEEIIKAWDASSSSSESSEERINQYEGDGELRSRSNPYHVAVRNGSSKKTGDVLSTSNQDKSLLDMSGTIFKDSSSESCEDDTSQARTKTPSDNSSQSDYSEDDNNAIQELPQTGDYESKRKENGGTNITKSQSSGPKNVTLDMILRSSSRYKKAKLTASQSQVEDTESQPTDFVQDSQALP